MVLFIHDRKIASDELLVLQDALIVYKATERFQEVQGRLALKLDELNPYKDPRVNFVLRRVVRGLSAYHKLESCISDDIVWVGYMPSVPQASLEHSLGQFSLGDDFVKYGFSTVNDAHSTGILSVWAIRLFGNRDFVGIVSSFSNAAERYAQVFNED